MRIQIPTTLDIKTFSNGKVNIARSYTKNIVYDRSSDGKIYATQRPGVIVSPKANDEGAGAKGRGIYYWQTADLLYVVNDNVVYQGLYDTALSQNISSGTERVYFYEIGSYLVIIDSENNEGWTINSSATTTLTKITDTEFPPNQTPALTLAKGGAVLNETLFVGCTNGEVWNSSVENPTAWAGTDFITAEASKDNGVYLTKHNQHIVFFGRNSIEFFYWANNPTGSPLNVRTDITIDIGGVDFHTYWKDQDNLYFLSNTATGGLNAYVMNGFQLTVISDPDINKLFQNINLGLSTTKMLASGFSSAGKSYYVLTTYTLSGGVIAPIESYIYDSTGGWTIWSICLSGYCDYPIIDYSYGSTTNNYSYGILHNGDILASRDENYTADLGLSDGWVADGWVADGWVAGVNDLIGEYINVEMVLPPIDAGTMDYKYASNLRLVRTPQSDYYEAVPGGAIVPDTSDQVNIQWSDDELENYFDAKIINMFEPDSSIRRCGRFRTRQHKITYSGKIHIALEALEIDIEKGM